jgi:hypothetical protein
MAYGLDFLTGGTATSSGGYQTPDKGFDDNTATYYQNLNSVPCWVKYDLGSGVAKIGEKYTITLSSYGSQYCPSAWVLEGSNNDSDWTQLDSRSGITWSSAYEKKEFEFSNATAYRYYKWTFSAPNGPICIAEFEVMAAAQADAANYLWSRGRDRMRTKGISLGQRATIDGNPSFLIARRNRLRTVGISLEPAANLNSIPWSSPTMTAANAPSPYVVSASTEYAAEVAWKAFDGNATTNWNTYGAAVSAGQWIKLDRGAAPGPVITGCTIVNYLNYGFNSFKVQGSNNNSDWTDIYSDAAANNTDVQTFSFSANTTAYKYIRFLCVTGHNTNTLAVYEITISGTE